MPIDIMEAHTGNPVTVISKKPKHKTELINIHVSKHMNLHGSAKLHVHVLATKVMYYSKSKRLNLTCGIKNTIFP